MQVPGPGDLCCMEMHLLLVMVPLSLKNLAGRQMSAFDLQVNRGTVDTQEFFVRQGWPQVQISNRE